MKIVWLEDALADLDNIFCFVALDSEVSAAKIHDNILDQVGKLANFPLLGMVDPRLNAGRMFIAL
jgi:plasmid stabilization system protein ParE